MKRVIKFRGKRTDTGEWAYGSLIKFDIGYVITISETTESDDSLDENNSIVFSADEIAGANPDTIGQFTGLLDKNGKEIYEGDILSMDCFKTDLGQYAKRMVVSYEVKDYNDGTQWSWFNLTNIEDDIEYAFFRSKKMTVIGNIHDNPELLKGGKE